jgi:3-oxoacyl-[acyl-carrier protein] reductase
MTKKLNGKVALVTGASKGIGAAIALRLAAEGAAVAVNYSSSKEGADRVVAEITKNGGKAVAVQGDLSKQPDIRHVIDATVKAFGPLDILVNNAGIYQFEPLEAITPESFHKTFDLNVLGLLLTTQEAVKSFNPKGGSVINVSSVVTSITPPTSAVYTASKGAVDAITGVLAKELAPKKIRVNSLNPGMILTEGVQSAGMHEGAMADWVVATAPLGRVGTPDEMAGPTVFLASDDSSYITGTSILASGGLK